MNQRVTHRFSDTLYSKERVVSARTRWERDETLKWLIANRYTNTTQQSMSHIWRGSNVFGLISMLQPSMLQKKKCSDYLQMRKHININNDTHSTQKPANTNERSGWLLPTHKYIIILSEESGALRQWGNASLLIFF